MNIWQWVHDTEKELREHGHGRLAELLDELPSAVCADRHEQVDALVPEALALARGLELPWVELFVRHWSLQSRVLHRMDASALGDALSLLDFAHAETTRDCPQAVCSVQDLSACYEHVDDVGYAADRVAVAEEALARIDPSWPCFECISEELGSALGALGKHEESLSFLVSQERAAKSLVSRAFSGRFGTRASALMELGRHEEALTLVRERSRGQTERNRIELAAILESLALAGLGRLDEAARALARVPDPLLIPAHYQRWAEAAEALVIAGELANDVPFGQVLQAMLARLDRQGIGRALVRLSERAGRLAVARGSAPLAASALATMERAALRLVRPSDAEPSLAALREAAAGLSSSAPELPDTPEAPAVFARPCPRRPARRELWPARRGVCALARARGARRVVLQGGQPPRGGRRRAGAPRGLLRGVSRRPWRPSWPSVWPSWGCATSPHFAAWWSACAGSARRTERTGSRRWAPSIGASWGSRGSPPKPSPRVVRGICRRGVSPCKRPAVSVTSRPCCAGRGARRAR